MKTQVEYEDGTVHVYKVKPKHLVAFEEMFGGFDESVKGVYNLSHIASGSKDSFEAWLDKVDDITPIEAGKVAEKAETVPTE